MENHIPTAGHLQIITLEEAHSSFPPHPYYPDRLQSLESFGAPLL